MPQETLIPDALRTADEEQIDQNDAEVNTEAALSAEAPLSDEDQG